MISEIDYACTLMAKIVPMEVSHIFAWVEKAKKFSIFPRALDQRFESDEEYVRYRNACRLMYVETKSVTIFDIAWNHDKLGFGPELAIKEKLSMKALEGGKGGAHAVLRRVSFDEIEFLWDRRSVKGFFKCAVVMELVWPSASILSLFACSDEPAFVQGGNIGLRSALNYSKKIAKNQKIVAILFRGSEVEIFPHESILTDLFVEGFAHCYKR